MRKGPRTLHFAFTDASLTHLGGMVLLQRFCIRLQLRHRLQRQLRLPHRRGDYAPADLILALLFAVIAGLRRLNKTDILQYNGTFLSLLGLERFPDQSSLRRFLKRLSPDAIRQLVRLHDQLRRLLFIAREPRNQFKSTVYIPLDKGVRLSLEPGFQEPDLSAFRKQLSSGRMLFGVRFSGGRVVFDRTKVAELLRL
jgi:hypothetical protein